MESTKSTKFFKFFGTAETVGMTGFERVGNQKTKLFTIVAKESCTQLYITIRIKDEKRYCTEGGG